MSDNVDRTQRRIRPGIDLYDPDLPLDALNGLSLADYFTNLYAKEAWDRGHDPHKHKGEIRAQAERIVRNWMN